MPTELRTALLATILTLSVAFPAFAQQARQGEQSAPAGVDSTTPIYQLRIYEIFPRNKAAFHARFRDHAVRIMQRYDFHIRAMWETEHEGRTEFSYILEWPDQATLADRWEKFLADEEWTRIKQETAAEHGTLVGTIEDRTLYTLTYGPRLPPAPR